MENQMNKNQKGDSGEVQLNNQSISSQSGTVDIVDVNDEHSPDIFKLSCIHFDEIFELLPLKDLCNFGRTCKRLKNYAGYYIKTNYVNHIVEIAGKRPNTRVFVPKRFEMLRFGGDYNEIYLSDYMRFFQNFRFSDDCMGNMASFSPEQYESIKELQLSERNMMIVGASAKNEFIRKILSKIERLNVIRTSFRGAHKNLLVFCPNVKRLCVCNWDDNEECHNNDDWLYQIYPKLEYFYVRSSRIDELMTFLENNPSICHFSTSERILPHLDFIMKTEKKLETFILQLNISCFDSMGDAVCKSLNQLHKRGFYKHLCIYFGYMNQKQINEVGSLNGIVKLGINDFYRPDRDSCPDLSPFASLTSLQELFLYNTNHGRLKCSTQLVNYCTSITRIHIKFLGNVEHILPFIRHSVKLRHIRIERIYKGTINVAKLNREREKLEGARKIIMYIYPIDETKWNNLDTNLKLIEIRPYSFEYVQHFHDEMFLRDNN